MGITKTPSENIGSFASTTPRGGKQHDRQLPPLSFPMTLLPALFAGACMTYLTMTHSQAFAGALLLLAAVMAILTLRSPYVIAMLTIPAFLMVTLTGSLTAAAVPLALLCGTAYGAFLLLNVPSLWLAVIPAVAFGAGLWATGNVGAAVLSLLCLPAAVTLAVSLRRGTPRIRTICLVAAALILPLLIFGVGYVLTQHGTDVLGNLSALISSARHALAVKLAARQMGGSEETAGVVLEGVEIALAGALFNILPGLLLALFAILAYLTDLVCLTLFRTYERAKYLSRRVFILAVSLPAATFFLLGYLLLLLLGQGGDADVQFAAAVVENLYLALLPVMVLGGVLCCIRVFLLSSHRLILLVGAILLVALAPAAVLTGLSLLGAGDVVWQTVRRWLIRRKNDQDKYD